MELHGGREGGAFVCSGFTTCRLNDPVAQWHHTTNSNYIDHTNQYIVRTSQVNRTPNICGFSSTQTLTLVGFIA